MGVYTHSVMKKNRNISHIGVLLFHPIAEVGNQGTTEGIQKTMMAYLSAIGV